MKISPWIKYPAIAVALIFAVILFFGIRNIGLLERFAVFQSRWDEMNGKSLDFYGKVVDQNSNPVIGAKVTGYVQTAVGFEGTKETPHYTQTDSEGNFEFLGFHGMGLGVGPAKEGYEFSGREGSGNWSDDYKASPNNRVLFHMWKLQGADRMIKTSLENSVPADGSNTSYNLMTGNRVFNGVGDLNIQLLRNPVNLVNGTNFDWSVSFQIPNGGLIENNDLYQNEAPADGYQSSVTINMSKNATNWSPELNRSYYFKINNGQNYGRMTIQVTSDFQSTLGFLQSTIYVNLSGSRNLEYNPDKIAQP